MLCAIMGVLSTELVIALMPITVIKAITKDPKNQGSNEFFFLVLVKIFFIKIQEKVFNFKACKNVRRKVFKKKRRHFV